MSLPAGAKIGPYEIVALLGAGGMGEVYRGRDSRLNRDVALKILLHNFAAARPAFFSPVSASAMRREKIGWSTSASNSEKPGGSWFSKSETTGTPARRAMRAARRFPAMPK